MWREGPCLCSHSRLGGPLETHLVPKPVPTHQAFDLLPSAPLCFPWIKTVSQAVMCLWPTEQASISVSQSRHLMGILESPTNYRISFKHFLKASYNLVLYLECVSTELCFV